MTSLLWNTSYFLYTDLQLVQLAIRHPVDCAEAIKEFPKDNFHKTHFAADEEVKKLYFFPRKFTSMSKSELYSKLQTKSSVLGNFQYIPIRCKP